MNEAQREETEALHLRIRVLEAALMDALYGAADGPHLNHTLERTRLRMVLEGDR